MQAGINLSQNYNRSVEGFRDSIAREGFRLAASQDPHIKQFLKVMKQEPLAAIPVMRINGDGTEGLIGYDRGILCMTKDFFVYAEGHRILSFNNDYEMFDRARIQSAKVFGEEHDGIVLRKKGYRPDYSYFYGGENDLKRFVEAADVKERAAPPALFAA